MARASEVLRAFGWCAVSASVALAGCQATRSASVTQPRLAPGARSVSAVAGPSEASFMVTPNGEWIVDVAEDASWPEHADPASWRVRLEHAGRRWSPLALVERRVDRRDAAGYTCSDELGQTRYLPHLGLQPSRPYVGRARLRFANPGGLGQEPVTLVVESGDHVSRYAWTLGPQAAAPASARSDDTTRRVRSLGRCADLATIHSRRPALARQPHEGPAWPGLKSRR